MKGIMERQEVSAGTAVKTENEVMNFLYEWTDQNIKNIDFKVITQKNKKVLSYDDFSWDKPDVSDDRYVLEGNVGDISAMWTFTKVNSSLRAFLRLESENPLDVESISPLVFDYYPKQPISELRFLCLPRNGLDYAAGTLRLDEMNRHNESLNTPAGVFYNHSEQGLFISTIIPQSNLCRVEFTPGDNVISWDIISDFNLSMRQNTYLQSETIYITTGYPPLKSFEKYAENYPVANQLKKPVKGWSSWDYYFSTVRMADVEENMKTLERMPFRKEIEILAVDDGWEYLWGDWKPNYKFPQAFHEIAQRISDKGYIPGIWTAPAEVNETTYIAFRCPDMLVKNEYGDPYKVPATGNFLIDPTVPAGEQYIRELFTELYEAGFRFFKIDYVSSFLSADLVLYNKEKGVYDAIRRLFEIIRESVKESHILGCSLPPETGAWIADSGRTGFDIHNQWTHAEWAVEYYLFRFWMQNRIWINDIDYLVVRGKETCTEGGLNVADHNLNNRERPRWRRGDVFNKTEAETWTNAVMMSGSNLFLSDRLNTLNEDGLELVNKAFEALPVSAFPLDLCDRPLPSFWLQQTDDVYRLTVINWEDRDAELIFSFEDYSISPPQRTFKLKAHGSTVVTW